MRQIPALGGSITATLSAALCSQRRRRKRRSLFCVVGLALSGAVCAQTPRVHMIYMGGKECARLAEIAEVIEKLPMAYETIVSDSRAPISGGEKQRLYIARALYKDPKILILDEAINQVDLPTAIKLSTALAQQKMTRIIVTHNEKLTDLCGRPILVNLNQWMPKTLVAAPGGTAQLVRGAAS